MGNFLNSHAFRVYVIPGCVFQSVMVGGGYGTGREVVEYFTRFGLYGGLLGLVVTFLVMATVLATLFELARLYRSYDYRSLMKTLLGPAWLLFELITITMLPLVLAVLAAASGKILQENLGISYWTGLGIMMSVIALLTFYGRDVVSKVLTYWSFFLYAVFVTFFAVVISQGGENISASFARPEILDGWDVSGFKYAMYNLTIAPLILYTAHHFSNRKEAVGSGIIAALLALIPGALFHIAFYAVYPEVVDQELPVYWMIDKYGMSVLLIFYTAMLFGTFIETGAGILQGINERIDNYLVEKRGRAASRNLHALIAVGAITVSALLSTWGITNIIGQGYGMIAWIYFAIFVIPLLTLGVWKIVKANGAKGKSFTGTVSS
ncbi:hypothetical protein HBA55_02650 [Pseudomaricurvus alkylphenolicus]|uniref:YkvI family membrane protein n=1 Tax=Pseudomaricurvus alkylphenolicus TaxID=1306991 RepID=UPI00141E0FDF|nr:hypothetical protein [Pseudomaricurvus alkylphenolicus]NIB38464.1 hypothetical protein [Pseudomaricurvus alkylphenolicus]